MPKWFPSFDIQTSLIYTLQTELLGRSESSHLENLEFCSLLKEKEYLCRDNRISYQDNGSGVPHGVRKGAFTPHPEPKLHGQGCTTWKGQWNNEIAAHCTWCHGQWKEIQTFDLILCGSFDRECWRAMSHKLSKACLSGTKSQCVFKKTINVESFGNQSNCGPLFHRSNYIFGPNARPQDCHFLPTTSCASVGICLACWCKRVSHIFILTWNLSFEAQGGGERS